MGTSSRIGVVVIGRNEGERLVRSLASVAKIADAVVYVDSGSTDDSVAEARRFGAIVVDLPMDLPFTAGRARNAGFAALPQHNPEIELVQFIDGDCVLTPDWLSTARDFLDNHPSHAIVCGHRREQHPDRTLYNHLCDLEWYGPTGDSSACGGDFMTRAGVFADIGGFNPILIAGEEPEMCHRIRRAGYLVRRLDAPMTWHDAAMTRFGQWVRRTSRSGYAYAARAALHWRDGTRFCWRENARIVFWAAVFPATAVVLAAAFAPWWLSLLLIYPYQVFRQWRRLRAEHPGKPVAAAALLTVLGKWPEFHGQCLFLARILTGREQRLIEYK
ncbi:MAG: glycosyltransferase [Pseudomonadales bacterium]